MVLGQSRIGLAEILSAMIVFVIASICCEFSKSFGWFYFRIMEATIATGVVLGRAIVRDQVKMDKAASMIGYITMAMTIMPMLGPAIGGFVEEYSEWQLSFRIMSILGFLTIILVWLDQGETIGEKQISIVQQFYSYTGLIKSKCFILFFNN